ncbi:MAG: hypothetical protein A3A96_00465 [Candidatus Zambryskibacteria bacterium RIFCSPLOWO2_01_FULL_39_39]|uniref:Uncharacterized protein n=1 Tax=Candidatus Zambryskibacteria bacterium RIFCSPLOWO2_01_FULL_39_39 TaxID=1802758 RepID=A0A1G2TXL3_9BACT|nr:MAG: hypothetical protein A2644_01430 [Candidatus Zambryskibacteria bacterium RIFCSPHIGHO2_01_FULL_39_63]OHA94956.1 MAG: hypothetical protein A3B88_01085 [Candidatus Zambryskibacteria bacterium RIFCSPHIGHO2_02_FULL_39_19]OHA99137.1 MAG: hypothetical protein A3F20_03035 [Candidatus Zambryskibacteria bacterium RIFCSPHIGHO2_12_FULL_39_21]OHB01899.1 MAG: hypothetical protein A3A96_00465 [Candidatus Zambryskibacteria bacterium RIFCSPLOWO2_01_FULL_39_39]
MSFVWIRESLLQGCDATKNGFRQSHIGSENNKLGVFSFVVSLEQIVSYINEIWLDPDYELVIVPDKCQRITIGSKK